MASNCLFLFLFCLIPLLWSSPKVEEDGNDWKTCCRIGRFTRSGSLSDLKPAFPTSAASTGRPPPPNFPAMDLHDDLQKSKKALRIADLINGSDQWTRSSVTVVQVGDALDRGGKFITMNDNHEVMKIDGDFRFVTKPGHDEFRVWANWFRVGNSIKSQYSGIAALRPEGPISTRFLSLNHTVMAVDDSVVVHGGVSSEYSPVVELGRGENNAEHVLPAIEFILSMTPTQNYVSICPISLVLCGYLGCYESVSLNWGWVECLVMSFENWKAHKWKERVDGILMFVDKSSGGRLNVQGFPTILVFGADKESPLPYEGVRTASAIESFALEQLEMNVSPPEVTKLTASDVMEEKCGSAAICFVAFLPDILDSKADRRNKYLEMLLTVAEKFKRSPYSYVWEAAGKQPDLEKNVGVGGYGYPALVALNAKKGAYAPLRSVFELDQIKEFVKEVGYQNELLWVLSILGRPCNFYGWLNQMRRNLCDGVSITR